MCQKSLDGFKCQLNHHLVLLLSLSMCAVLVVQMHLWQQPPRSRMPSSLHQQTYKPSVLYLPTAVKRVNLPLFIGQIQLTLTRTLCSNITWLVNESSSSLGVRPLFLNQCPGAIGRTHTRNTTRSLCHHTVTHNGSQIFSHHTVTHNALPDLLSPHSHT